MKLGKANQYNIPKHPRLVQQCIVTNSIDTQFIKMGY